MALIIEERQVRELITLGDAMDALIDMYREAATGGIVEADRSNLILPTGFLRVMAAAAPNRSLAGYKEFHRFNGQVRYAYHLYDTNSGAPLAMLDAGFLTLLRTGACGGIGVDLLARRDSHVLAMIGSGAEARSQLAAVLAVRDITSIRVFSRTAERRERFCSEIVESYGIETVPCSEAQTALEGADIIITATASGGSAALLGEWLNEPGVHINSIGSTLPSQREIDEQVWERSDRIIIDAALLLDESGDAIAARAAGTLHEERVALFEDLIAAKTPGRVRESDVTMYKSVGSALQDLAVAAWVYERAAAAGEDFKQLPDFQSVAVVTG